MTRPDFLEFLLQGRNVSPDTYAAARYVRRDIDYYNDKLERKRRCIRRPGAVGAPSSIPIFQSDAAPNRFRLAFPRLAYSMRAAGSTPILVHTLFGKREGPAVPNKRTRGPLYSKVSSPPVPGNLTYIGCNSALERRLTQVSDFKHACEPSRTC